MKYDNLKNGSHGKNGQIMWQGISFKRPLRLAILAGISVLAACQPAANTPVIAPPPVVIAPVSIPSAPLPPLGAAAGLTIPALAADGTRSTPNKDLGPEETLWHLRSSFNVAALTCQQGNWARIAQDYNAFIKKHDRRLAQANRAIEGKFQRENRGRAGRRARDTHITSLYNYFSLPPVKTEFCSTMLNISSEMSALSSSDLKDYAQRTLPRVDAIFTGFYDSYEAYEKELADWRRKYGN